MRVFARPLVGGRELASYKEQRHHQGKPQTGGMAHHGCDDPFPNVDQFLSRPQE